MENITISNGKTVEHHHAIDGKTSTISTGPFSSSQSVKLPEGQRAKCEVQMEFPVDFNLGPTHRFIRWIAHDRNQLLRSRLWTP